MAGHPNNRRERPGTETESRRALAAVFGRTRDVTVGNRDPVTTRAGRADR
jgi:hypothetical protein